MFKATGWDESDLTGPSFKMQLALSRRLLRRSAQSRGGLPAVAPGRASASGCDLAITSHSCIHTVHPVSSSRASSFKQQSSHGFKGGLYCHHTRRLCGKLVARTVGWPTWRDTSNGGCVLCSARGASPGVLRLPLVTAN